MEFLTEQGKNEKDWEEHKPYVAGEKKGKVWERPTLANPTTSEDDEFTAPTEWDDVLINASESEIVELAGLFLFDFSIEKFSFSAILGFTGLINQVQFHAAVTGKGTPAHAGGWNGMMNV